MRITVGASGPPTARIALVGEQPGVQEIQRGTPFIGPAGRELDECLRQAGIVRGECYLTNTIKNLDHPLDHFIVKPERKEPSWTPDGLEFVKLLQDELSAIKPNVIVAIGNVAMFALGARWGITKWRGSIFESSLVPGRKVVACIHPSTILPPKFQYENKLLISLDLARAKKESAYPELRLKERIVKLRPSFNEVLDFLDACNSVPIIDFDVELDMFTHTITCFSISIGPHAAMCIPFMDHQGNYWNPEQEEFIWLALARLLENPKVAKRGQNIITELQAVLRDMGIHIEGRIHDTMVAEKILMPDYPKGLDFICSIHTDMPYYKDEGKQWIKGAIAKNFGGWDRFYTYNGYDTMATAAASTSLMFDLQKQSNLQTYERQCKIIPILTYMMERGTRVDMAGIEEERKKAEKKVEDLERQFFDMTGGVSWNSPKQLLEYFELKGYKIYQKKTKKGYRPTTDDDALKRMIRSGIPEANIIKDLRFFSNKVLSTYLAPENFSTDGRIRCAYDPVGTETGRLSSRSNIYGEGTNLQNWPHWLLRHLHADDGYIYISPDLSQAENRIVAYVGRVIEMIEAFEAGIDIHSKTASLIFGRTIEEMADEDKLNIPCDLGDGRHTRRYWGKKANHGLNYDLGPGTFALKYEMKDAQAKWIIDRYHLAYPGVRASYHPLIRAMLTKNRTVDNLMGRHRLFLGAWGDKLFKDAYAQIPQSTVADKINEQGLIYLYYSDDPLFKSVELLNQIHDSIGFQIPVSIGWPAIAEIMIRLKQSLETPLRWHDREFVIPVDFVVGLTLEKESGVELKHKKWPASKEALAMAVETAYNKLLVAKGG